MPRIPADLDAELHVEGATRVQGHLVNLAARGGLFRPLHREIAAQGYRAVLVLPCHPFLRVPCELMHITDCPAGSDVQSWGLAFHGLTDREASDIAVNSFCWARTREQPAEVHARCFVRGLAEKAGFGSFAFAEHASWTELHLRFSSEAPLETGASIDVAIRQRNIACRVRRVERQPSGETLVVARFEGWGRDFTLEEVRQSAVMGNNHVPAGAS